MLIFMHITKPQYNARGQTTKTIIDCGELDRAMVRSLARRSGAKISMARPNEPDMPPKRTKKVRLGINRIQIQPEIR